MDLIYADANKVDIGVLAFSQFDLAFGSDENNFELTLPLSSHCCGKGFLVYIENTEYGGIIDDIGIDTAAQTVKYIGRTWQGILASKIVLPLQASDTEENNITLYTADSGRASLVDRYLVISGTLRGCLLWLLSRCGLSSLFTVAMEGRPETTVPKFQFDRYCDLYSAMTKLLRSIGRKLTISYTGKSAQIKFPLVHDYSTDEEWDSDVVTFTALKKLNAPNHLICLGKGELEDRMVRHLYADADGVISQTQTFFGLDEYVAIYDYSSVESEEELLKGGREKLQSLRNSGAISLSLSDNDSSYDIGDIVGARENTTGIVATGRIVKKIVTIQDGKPTISYEVGD